MILITKTKKPKKYQMPKMPHFQHRKSKMAWLKKHKMLTTLSTINFVSVQVKDIKYMIYSQNPRLILFYTKFNFSNSSSSYNDNDYITISKSTTVNKSLMYDIITADWLIDEDDIKNKSVEDIEQDCIELQNKIFELSEIKKQIIDHSDIERKIKLFQYKLSCLTEIIINKTDKEIIPNQIIKKKNSRQK